MSKLTQVLKVVADKIPLSSQLVIGAIFSAAAGAALALLLTTKDGKNPGSKTKQSSSDVSTEKMLELDLQNFIKQVKKDGKLDQFEAVYLLLRQPLDLNFNFKGKKYVALPGRFSTGYLVPRDIYDQLKLESEKQLDGKQDQLKKLESQLKQAQESVDAQVATALLQVNQQQQQKKQKTKNKKKQLPDFPLEEKEAEKSAQV